MCIKNWLWMLVGLDVYVGDKSKLAAIYGMDNNAFL